MTISKKESEWAKRITMWFSVGRIVWGSIIAGFIFGVPIVESHWVRPYVANVVKNQYDTLHAPADKQLEEIGYQVKLSRNILELWVGDSILLIAKRRVDSDYWKKNF